MLKPKRDDNCAREYSSSGKILSLSDCLAKTYGKQPGRQVFEHCHIVGEVAREIMARMPIWLKEELFPNGSELIAAIHDIGKISPMFQEKIYRGVDGYLPNSKSGLENINPELEKNWGGHAAVSQVAVDKWSGIEVGKFVPEILGRHHGYSPKLCGRLATDWVFGGKVWQEQRKQCIDELKLALNCSNFPQVKNDYHAMVLSGLTTVADWIGSSSWFENPAQFWQPLISKALDEVGFVQPKLENNLTFEEVFGFAPHEAQQKLIGQAIQPGIYIMEAPMGSGKTEAALYAAYKALTNGKATGIYFALPTQLTSDKIHDRVNNFLQKILVSDCHHRQALLLHGNAWLAWLKETELGEEDEKQPGGSWFQSGKRGILAPFAVGTIDQALMAVMNVKHGFVRTFGLAGKVVILDEVHSYDAYTGTILNTLVKALRELHCTVIILSATLTKERRDELLALVASSEDYPLISSLPKHCTAVQEIVVKPLAETKVVTKICHDDIEAIEEALCRAEQGQQVLWIENTVAEAQEKYGVLAARAHDMNVACGLLHSRFLKTDRANNEAHWVSLYGKNNNIERKKQGRILVGTQVLEQSLDIDADFLITRICPTDMLLQRLGRLWRHQNNYRPELAVQEAWILSPSLAEVIVNPEKALGKTAKVYSPYVLYRSLEIWEKLETIILPKDIRSLIEATYVEREEVNAVLKHKKQELMKKREDLGRLALIGISTSGTTLPESKASTRYIEQDIVEVLLIRSYRHRKDKSGTDITLLSGEEIYLLRKEKLQDKKSWRANAAKLMENIVNVANYLAPKTTCTKNLWWLKDYLYLGNNRDEESLLRVAEVRESGELFALDSGNASDDYDIHYDTRLGYQAEKR